MVRNAWLLVLATATALACVPKKELEKSQADNKACYEALRKENNQRKELASALTDLKDRMDRVRAERERLAAEKGELAGNVAELEAAVSDKLSEIQNLAAEKERLEEEAAQLAAKTETYDELVSSLKREMESKLIEVKQQGQRITVNLNNKILFASGSTALREDGRAALVKIAGVLSKVQDRRIDVEGHTDNVPITGELKKRFPSNWELSAARATNVVRYLEENGVNPRRMAAVGKSMHWPTASNTSDEGKQLNRRIEIVLTPWDGRSS
jgi:chemotaxis protein MotB